MYRAGVERWRACMAKRGLSYGEPEAAANALSDEYQEGRLTLEPLRQREIEAATAEASCAREVGLEVLFEAARTRAEGEVEREHRSLLESLVALQTEAIGRAGHLAPP